MKKKSIFIAANAGLLLACMLAACAPSAASVPTATPTATTPPATVPAKRARYHFVTDRLLVPTTQAQAQQFALDVDGDSKPDNLFGQVLAALVSIAPGLDFQPDADEAVKDGPVFILHVLQADDLSNAADASWSIFQGHPSQTPPKFDGSDQFTLDPAAPIDSHIAGAITDGHFAGGPGTARVRTRFMGQLIDLDLIGVHVESDVSINKCANGRLAGGLRNDEFRAKLLPVIAAGLNQVIKADPGGAATQTLQATFDTNQDGKISTDELENNLLLKAVISPDLDLLDAAGKFNPRQDGMKDALSAGFGFTCVAAKFTAPGE